MKEKRKYKKRFQNSKKTAKDYREYPNTQPKFITKINQ